MTTEPETREHLVRRIIGVFLAILLLYCGYWAVQIARIGWNHPILDMHGVRQTQTAISSYYMQRGSGGLLNYENPVLGYPWEIPFEFPLYQFIVAIVANSLHTPLDQTGRAVSEFFWIATLVLLWPLLGELKVRPAFRPLFIILLLISPQYLFWSRTFAIESTALCLGTGYLLYVLRYLRLRHPRELIAGILLGSLAALVKITTLPAFAVLGFCAYVAATYHAMEAPRTPRMILRVAVREALPVLLLFAAPLLAGSAWTAYTDSIRMKNPVCNPYLHSAGPVLRKFIFSTFSQRIQPETWEVFLNARVRDAVGSIRIPLLAIGCFAIARLHWRKGLLCLAAYLTPMLAFTNLFVVHNYYAYANALFLAGFVGFGILALLENRILILRGAALLILGYSVFVSLQRYELEYRKAQEYRDTVLPAVSQTIRAHTDPDEVMVAAGLGSSPAIPYYAERRGFLVPDWAMEGDSKTMTTLIEQGIESLAPRKVGAVAVCMDARKNDAILQILRRHFGLKMEPAFVNDMCAVYDLDPATPHNPQK